MRATPIALALALSLPALASPYRWRAEFTKESDAALRETYETLCSDARLDAAVGVAVRDAHFRRDGLDVHLVEGTIWLERPIDGYPTTAWFEGTGTATFAPEDRRARVQLASSYGRETIESDAIDSALFFTLDGRDLAEQLGIERAHGPALASTERYALAKAALRQLGTETLAAFLDRDGRAAGTTDVLLPLKSIRDAGSEDAFALYTLDPTALEEVRLRVAGAKQMSDFTQYRALFGTISAGDARSMASKPAGRVEQYSTRLTVGSSPDSAVESTTIHFTPVEGVRALRLALTPRLHVRRVFDSAGRTLPFVQWEWLRSGRSPNGTNLDLNADENLTVAFPEPLPAGEPFWVAVESDGTLFEPVGLTFWLAEEDRWHPRLDDPKPSRFELELKVPRSMIGVGAGRLVDHRVEDGKNVYLFRTTKPAKRSTFYLGDFLSETQKADDTEVEVYVDKMDTAARGNLGFAAKEVANMIRVYDRLYLPLGVDHIRVAATPTLHGRGFEGLILLSRYGGFSGDQAAADLFRAHEVAHQWWGNMVDTLNWPSDRWLSESFAEYSAMEYLRIRDNEPKEIAIRTYRQWVQPTLSGADEAYRTLQGDKRKDNASELFPLIEGGQIVYTKGPLVLHGLRYLFVVAQGSDAGFWEMLRTFLRDNRDRQVTTADFKACASKALGQDLGWFFDQWIYRAEIPNVSWSWKVHPIPDGFGLDVEATETTDTGFVLVCPVTAHLSKGRVAARPILIQGGKGTFKVGLPERPKKVTLDEGYECLARFDER